MSVGIVVDSAAPPPPPPKPKPKPVTPVSTPVPASTPAALDPSLKPDTVCLAPARQADLSSALLTANAPPAVQPTTQPTPQPGAKHPAAPRTASSPPPSSSLKEKLNQILDLSPGWPTLVSTAHAAYTARAEMIDALTGAAAKNRNVAVAIDGLAKNWSSMSPAERDTSARDLVALGENTAGVKQAAQVVGDANRVSLRVADTLSAWSKGNVLQRLGAWAAGSTLGKAILNRTVNQLPADAESALSATADAYSRAAAADTAKAAALARYRPGIGALSTTVGDAADSSGLQALKFLSDAKVVSDIPVVGAVATVAAAGYDVGIDHSNPVTAVVKESAGTIAGQAAYNVTRDALPKLVQGTWKFVSSAADAATGSAADTAAATVSEGAADAAVAGAADAATTAAAATAAEAGTEVVVAGGPAAWAVAGGVVAAAAVGFAATKFVEGSAHDFGAAVTKGGGEMVSGIASGNGGEIAKGAETTVEDVGKGFVDGAKSVADGFSGIANSVGGLVSSII